VLWATIVLGVYHYDSNPIIYIYIWLYTYRYMYTYLHTHNVSMILYTYIHMLLYIHWHYGPCLASPFWTFPLQYYGTISPCMGERPPLSISTGTITNQWIWKGVQCTLHLGFQDRELCRDRCGRGVCRSIFDGWRHRRAWAAAVGIQHQTRFLGV